MLLSRWVPERLAAFDRFNRMMDEMFKGTEPQIGFWVPSVDIKETEEAYTITAELPGIERKNVKVELQGDVLTISGTRSFEKDEKREDYVRVERSYGEFQRAFTLDTPVKPNSIAAAMKDGVLTVKAQKAEIAAPQKIQVALG